MQGGLRRMRGGKRDGGIRDGMKARIQFTKTGSMRFLGHLDVMRYFQKLCKRSGVDLAYSQGFNPHPILSFASPLSVGATSVGEYLDMEMNSLGGGTVREIIEHMNAESNGEIEVVGMVLLTDEAKTSMSRLAAADYLLSIKEGYAVHDDARERFRAFLSRDSIPVVKRTKKSEKEIELKEYVYEDGGGVDAPEASRVGHGGGLQDLATVKLAAGSVVNIKPELLLGAFCEDVGVEYEPSAYQICRLEMYADVNAKKGELHANGEKEKRRLVPLSAVDVMESNAM